MSDDITTMTPGGFGSAAARGMSEQAAEKLAQDHGFNLFGDDGLNFYDLLDAINPLHHIPVVGAIYRELSGDEISPASRVAGGALFGGPIGAGLAAADTFIEYETGQDTGSHVMAALFDENEVLEGEVVAQATTQSTGQATAQNWGEPEIPWYNSVISGFQQASTEADKQLAASTTGIISRAELIPKAPEQQAQINQNTNKPAVQPGGGAWYGDVLLAFQEAGQQADRLNKGLDPQTATIENQGQPVTGARAYGQNTPATEGGWFTEAMLGALQKYDSAALLAENARMQGQKGVSVVQ